MSNITVHPTCLFLLVLISHGAVIEAVIDCNNEHFHSSLVGMKALLRYQAYLYNFGWDFENIIANDFFDGFKVIGRLVQQISLYYTINDRLLMNNPPSLASNITIESEYVSYFQSLTFDIVKNSCEWLKSYGLTFSLREINCTNPNEIALLASYIGSYTDAIRLLQVISQNSCSVAIDDEIEGYLNATIPAENMNARNDLKKRYAEFVPPV